MVALKGTTARGVVRCIIAGQDLHSQTERGGGTGGPDRRTPVVYAPTGAGARPRERVARSVEWWNQLRAHDETADAANATANTNNILSGC